MKRTAFQWLVISSLLLGAMAAGGRTRPRYGGSVRVEVSGSLWDANGMPRRLVAETLTRVDDQGRVQPWLAMKWESQNHDRRWIFTLRPDVKFHDGTQMTAASVADALSGCANCPWKSVQASGETVVFELEAPAPLFPGELALARYGVTRNGVNGAPIGTGPMKVTQSTPTTATLSAFDNYWNGHYFLDTVEVTANRKYRDQQLDLGVGRADVAEVPAEQIRRAQQDRLRVISSRDDELIVLVMNPASATMQNANLRQAIAESVDRSSLLNFIFQKQGELAGGILPNWVSGYASVFPTGQNLQHAKELRAQLSQAPSLTLTYDAADPSLQLVAERLALSSREAGINIRAVPAPAHWDLSVLRVRLNTYQPSVALEEIVAASGLEHKTPDDVTPEALYQRERELLKDRQLVPLLYVPHAFAASERVRNWSLEDGLPAFGEMWTEVRK